jgi:hypothetical protein
MKVPLTAALIAVTLTIAALSASAQETTIPDDSRLVSLNGCAKNGSFIVGERREDQPGTLEVEPGRRFRLNGPKKLLDEIRARQRGAMQVTGLLRKTDVNGPQGIGLLGGRVRIGGARVPQDPIANPARDPAYNQPVLDVRSWKSLTGDCR